MVVKTGTLRLQVRDVHLSFIILSPLHHFFIFYSPTNKSISPSYRLRQLGCPIAQGNHFLVWATMIYRRIAELGKYKSEVSLTPILSLQLQIIKNHVLITIHQHIPTF